VSEPSRVRPWILKVVGLIGLATLVGLTWWVTHDLGSTVVCLSLGCSIPAIFDLFKYLFTYNRGKPARRWFSLRFSIWQIMAVAGALAVYLGLLRALLTAYPIPDRGAVVILSATFLFVYVIFCGLARVAWIGVRNIRAVLREDRQRNLKFELAMKEKLARIHRNCSPGGGGAERLGTESGGSE